MTTTPRRVLLPLAALAAASLALAGCMTVPASGPRVTAEHEVSDAVHALRLDNAGDVVVMLGDQPGLTVRAPQAIMDRLTASEDDGTLVLGMSGAGMWVGRIEYTLTVRSFDEVELTGSGDVRADFSSAQTVSIEVSGSGDVRGTDVDAAEVGIEVSGSGDVCIDGAADRGEFEVSGSGDLDASGLALRTAEAEVSGSGDLSVHATDTLGARISGSGDMFVSGSPRITRDTPGSGDLIER